jgi:hypothetical protein
MTTPDESSATERMAQSHDSVDLAWDVLPESKLELWDGRLVVGASLMGSRALLWYLMQTLGVQAVVPLVSLDAWWDALGAVFPQPPARATPQAWMAWAAHVTHTPQITPAGPYYDGFHAMAASDLRMSLYCAAKDGVLGRSLGRDFVMRLGDDGVTPDLMLIAPGRFQHVHYMYLDGPADLVIEITMPGHEQDETQIRRRRYAAAGIPEYWIVDPTAQTMQFLCYVEGAYQEQPLAPDGRYRPTQFPGLTGVPARLWDALLHPYGSGDCHVFEGAAPAVPVTLPRPWKAMRADEWDATPFAPTIGRQPTRITFDHYLAWCPEAKFEWDDGQLIIGDWRGTRNVLGLLLMTFGLEATVSLLHPRTWVAGLLAEEAARRHDAGRRDQWWTLARQAADILRERFGVRQVAVIGDLVRPAPLHYWSRITLVVWDMPEDYVAVYVAMHAVSRDPPIEVINEPSATRRQRDMIAHEAILLTDDRR